MTSIHHHFFGHAAAGQQRADAVAVVMFLWCFFTVRERLPLSMLGQFSVVEREGMIIACAALYQIADSDAGELACLAVNPEYRHGGRGDELLERIETRARAQGLKTLFVLTTRTAHWFRERGFVPSSVDRLPSARASLYNYQRNSKIFEKAL